VSDTVLHEVVVLLQ